MAQMEFSRPLTTTPGTSKARLDILRGAFKATLADPEFLAQANKLKLDITHVSGEESEQLVNQVLSISPKIRENLGYLSSVK
jgi:tripartite-type tricarboxylate transporter receptor subunit TctC